MESAGQRCGRHWIGAGDKPGEPDILIGAASALALAIGLVLAALAGRANARLAEMR